MRKNRWWLLALLTVAALVVLVFLFRAGLGNRRPISTALAPRPAMTPAAKLELEKLYGTWEFVSMEVEGVQKPEADFKKFKAVLAGDQWTVWDGTNIAAQTTMELDPTTEPKHLDLIPRPGKGEPIRGIYRLEGNQLKYCDRSEDNGDRPTEFASLPDSGLVLIVLKRIEP